MVIRQELDRAIKDSVPGSAQQKGALRLRGNLDTVEADGFVDRPVENIPYSSERVVYSIDGGRIIYDSGKMRFESRDAKENVISGHLTRTEGRIIELFLKQPGRVIRHWTIEEEVWGGDANMSKQVKKYIQRLRCKLDPDNEDPRDSIIQNVRGVGYKLVVPVVVVDNTHQITKQVA